MDAKDEAEVYPEDMDQALKARLRYDFSVFGTAFYKETEDGYEYVSPKDVTLPSPELE